MNDHFASTGTCDALVVATTRGWVADDFEPACDAAGIALVRSWGLDVPDLSGFARPAWWTPTEHAARLRAGGVRFPMQAPGPGWLSTLPAEVTGRRVWTGRLADIGLAPSRGWCKPAEFKHPDLVAAWFDSTAEFVAAARAAGVGPDAVVQVADTRLDISWEHRFFIAGGCVVGGSPYLDPDGVTWFEGMASPEPVRGRAAALAGVVAARYPGPDGYVLDIAETPQGPVVLEANPAFSSALYGTAPGAALATVVASAAGGAWAWGPDPYLVARASRQRPLPSR